MRHLALLSLAVLAGCFTTTTEKVEVRRTEAELARAREQQTQTQETVRERLYEANQKRRLDRELFARESRRTEDLKELRAFLDRVPDDPWTDYEEDRRRSFYRHWAGVRQPLPPLVAEDSGPPGWIGPKLPGAEAGGTPIVEGLGEEEEGVGPAAGEEGGEDEYGDEYGDDEEEGSYDDY
ncbi:MAG: hypothetical protein R3F62_10115 [Planctomycetota bacterium]